MLSKVLQRHFALIIVLIVVFSRLPTLATPIIDINEADFAVQTAIWMDGGIPYVDFVEKKTLLIHGWFRWIFEIFGVYNMRAVHAASMLLLLGTIAAIYFFVRYTSGEKVARWSALLYAFFQSFYDMNDFLSTNTETLMNFFAVLGAYVFFKSMREDRPGMSLLSGFLIGLSILAKQVGAAILPAFIISMVWFWYEQKQHHWGRYVEELFLLMVGVLFPITLHAAYVSDAGGFTDFVRWTWTENVKYASAGVGLKALLGRGLVQGGKFLAATSVLWVMSAWSVAYFVRRRRFRAEVIFLTAWVFFAIPAVSLGGRFYIHYFLQFLPPLVILAAIGIVGRWEFFLRSVRIKRSFKKLIRVGVVMVFLILPYIGLFALHVHEVGAIKDETWPIRHIAGYVRSITNPDDRIFVWGHDSDIYFYSGRRPASRFVYCSYLSGIKEGYESLSESMARVPDLNAWVMVRNDFKRNPPEVIVDLSPTNIRGYGAFPIHEQLFLANYVHDNYTLSKVVEGAHIYVRKL